MSTWSGKLKLDWDCAGRLIRSDVTDLSRMIEQDPPFSLEFLIKPECLSGQENDEIGLRLFASEILLTVHDSLRFSDKQRIATQEESDSVLYGTLEACKVRRQHGLQWPFASLKCDLIYTGIGATP